MKNKLLLLFITVAILSGCNQKSSSPLENWKVGSANDDVFIDMTQNDMDALVQNNLQYLEIDWLYSTVQSREEIENWATAIKKRADKAGITRSVSVNALRKFESAGVIESRSSGMKGTNIKVVNDCVFEELEKAEKSRAVLKKY